MKTEFKTRPPTAYKIISWELLAAKEGGDCTQAAPGLDQYI